MHNPLLLSRRSTTSLHRQRGAASLLVTMALLGLITYVSIYTSKTILVEQKISNNDFRTRQAFEAAEAGLSAAIDYLAVDPDRDENGLIDFIFDSNGDGVSDSAETILGVNNRVVVTTNDLSAGLMTLIEITSQGFSDDATANRRIIKVISTVDPLPNMPDNPMTTRGTVVITGSATVHNQEGHSTIWSGGDVDLGSNNSTATLVADVTDATYPACMDTSMTCNDIASSNKVTIGLDVIEHDSNLANLTTNEFFENFFGMAPTLYRDSMITLDTPAATADAAVQLAQNQVIWVEGDTTFSNNTTIGCTTVITGAGTCTAANTKPSIVIINGDATFSGTPHIYGLVFVTGSITISGNTTITGAIVTAGSLNNNTGGSLDVWYNSDVLRRTRQNGPLGTSSGSWRDFG